MKKAFCRNCKGDRNHEIITSERNHGKNDDYFFWTEDFQIIKCLGCETFSFRHIYGDSEMVNYEGEYVEDIKVYPNYLKNGREIESIDCLPEKIQRIYRETVIALKNDSYLLASSGLRACLEAICNDKDIVCYNLNGKIEELVNKGMITYNDSVNLQSIRCIGNDALHNTDIDSESDVYLLFEIINHTLESLYVKSYKMQNSKYLIIDNIESFIKAVENNIREEYISQILSLKTILGKSYELFIDSKRRNILIAEFINKAKNKEFDFIEYTNGDNFKIIKEPERKFLFYI